MNTRQQAVTMSTRQILVYMAGIQVIAALTIESDWVFLGACAIVTALAAISSRGSS